MVSNESQFFLYPSVISTNFDTGVCVCLFVCLILFFMSQSAIFLLCRDRSSWVEPVLSKD